MKYFYKTINDKRICVHCGKNLENQDMDFRKAHSLVRKVEDKCTRCGILLKDMRSETIKTLCVGCDGSKGFEEGVYRSPGYMQL